MLVTNKRIRYECYELTKVTNKRISNEYNELTNEDYR